MNKKKITKQRDELAAFHGFLVQICIQHATGTMATLNDPIERKVVNFTLIYNTHAIISFMFPRVNKMMEEHAPLLKNGEELLADWTEHFNKTVNPIFIKEVEKIREGKKKNKDIDIYG